MNRQQRRMAEKFHRVEVKKSLQAGEWTAWEDITTEAKERLSNMPEVDRLLRYYKNNLYTVQIIVTSVGKLVGIRRNDQSIDVTWKHKQRIKNELLGKEVQLLEAMPPESKLVDSANMYWLWELNIPALDLRAALKGVYSHE